MHLNLVRAKLLRSEQKLREYAWSSWPEYLKSPAKRPAWLRVDRYLENREFLKIALRGA